MTDKVDCLIIGSGLSGCSAAYYLQKKGLNICVAEERNVTGGNILSKTDGEFIWEEGPNTFQPHPSMLRFAKDIGILDDLVVADSNLPRFIFWDNVLHSLPMNLQDFINFKLLTFSGKIRAVLGFLGFIPSKSPGKEESIKEFMTRHLGIEVFEKMIDPFISGVYAGDPSRLSMQAALKKIKNFEDESFNGSLLGGGLMRLKKLFSQRNTKSMANDDLPKIKSGSLCSFKLGMQTMPKRIEFLLGPKVQLNHKLIRLEKDGSEWKAEFLVSNGERKIIRSKSIILATPSYVTSDLLQSLAPETKELEKVYYPPVAAVVAAYPKSSLKVPLKGFGHLFPRAMKVRTLGTIWASSLFKGRAPEDHVILVSFIGGSQDPEIINLSHEEILKTVHADNSRAVLKLDAPLPKVLGIRVWSKAIPQYEIGHKQLISRVEESVKVNCPGIFLSCNYRHGVALNDCVEDGMELSQRISEYLSK